METPQPKPQKPDPDIADIDTINNIDTARMALRWALERLHALEKSKVELTQKAEQEAKELRETMALRAQENLERELYYRKIEEYLSQHLSGQLDPTSMAKRELELAKREEMIKSHQEQLEKDFAARRAALEMESRRFKTEIEQGAQIQVRQAQQTEEERRKRFDKAYASKLTELSEKEIQIKAGADSLDLRRAQFEDFYQSQKAQMEAEIKAFHESVEDQVRFRLKSSESFMGSRYEALQASWDQEKAVLLKELTGWRHRAEEHLPKLLELEKTVAAVEENLRSSQVNLARYQERERAWEHDRGLFLQEISVWRKKVEAELQRVLELEKRAAGAEESAKRANETMNREIARREELERRQQDLEAEYQGRRAALEEEYRSIFSAMSKRQGDLDGLETLLLARLKEFEERTHSRDLEWRKREEHVRQRDLDWHEKLAVWQAHLTEQTDRVEELKAELLKSIQTYKAQGGGNQMTSIPSKTDGKMLSETSHIRGIWERFETVAHKLWQENSPAAVGLQTTIEEFKNEVGRIEDLLHSYQRNYHEQRAIIEKTYFSEQLNDLDTHLKAANDRITKLDQILAQKEARINYLESTLAAKEIENAEFHERYFKTAVDNDEARSKKMEVFYQEMRKKEADLEGVWEQRRKILESEHQRRDEELGREREALYSEMRMRTTAMEHEQAKRLNELTALQEKTVQELEAWNLKKVQEEEDLIKQQEALSLRATELEQEYERKRLELKNFKENLQQQVNELARTRVHDKLTT